jgi:hypothetical protein
MPRTLIVTDPLTLLAPPGPQTARSLVVEGDLLLAEDAATNVLRLSGESTSAQGGTLIVRGANDYTFVGVLSFIRQ